MATISERIVTATQQLEANVANLTGAVFTASGSATLAGTYATASDNSALASAASAAQAAAIAAGLNYKGTVAGASVPATSTNPGDVYLISSAGTSQSKTWAQTDLAIYRGSSGNWDQITASVWLGLSLPLANNKVVADCGISDGATSNRAVIQTNTGAFAGGLPTILAIEMPEVPTSNPSSNIEFFNATSSTVSPIQPYSFRVEIFTNGTLFIIQEDSPATTNRRAFSYAAFRSTYSGQRNGRLSIEWPTGDTTTSPTIYWNGVDITSLFTLTTVGTVPNWLSPSLVATYLLQGYNWPAGRIPTTTAILGTWTSTERDNWHRLGILPSWCLVGTGNAVNRITGDSYNFAGGTGTWGGTAAKTADAANAELDVSATSGQYVSSSSTAGLIKAGRRYRWSQVIRNSSFTSASITFLTGGANQVIGSGVAADGAVAFEFTALADATGILNFLNGASGSWSIAAPTLTDLGPVSRLIWQPCRVMDDLGSNNIPGIVAAGITPVTIRKDMRMQIQTSTNGNQQLGGNSLFLNSSSVRLDNWTIYNTGGTVTTSLGNVSAGTQYLSAGSITNGLNDVTLATRFNGTVNLWCNANSGIYLTHTIAAHLVV